MRRESCDQLTVRTGQLRVGGGAVPQGGDGSQADHLLAVPDTGQGVLATDSEVSCGSGMSLPPRGVKADT